MLSRLMIDSDGLPIILHNQYVHITARMLAQHDEHYEDCVYV